MSDSRSPGDYIRDELAARGWGQEDFARVIGRSIARVNDIIQGKQAITAEIAIELASIFGGDAAIWMQREATFRLSLASSDVDSIRKRARLFEMAPVKEMQKRGWIRSGAEVVALEADLLRFFDIASIEEEPAVVAAFRKSTPAESPLTPAQKAWFFRVRQIAKAMLVAAFSDSQLQKCEKALKKIAPYSPETRKVPEILAAHGIRFVIVEPISGSKIDGMTTWLDENSPVIGMSLRFDRIDSFWHTLCHEFRHVIHRDKVSIDTDFVADSSSVPVDVKPPFERRADAEAAAMLIPPKELESFIARVAPFFSKERIVQFANRIKVHPGVIVGQLQHRGEIGYSANREMIVKIRDTVTKVAVTDGWGTSIDPRIVE